MPLAITQAAAYINHGAPRITVSKYLSNFNKGTQHVMNLLGRDQQDFRRNGNSKNAMLTTLQMSFDQIMEARHSAAELLSLFGYYDRHLVPGSLLRTKKVNVQGTRGNKVINGDGMYSLQFHVAWTSREPWKNQISRLIILPPLAQ
jgi:hypothetical protein